MKLRIAVLLSVAVMFLAVSHNEASAANRRWRNRRLLAPSGPPTTLIPTREELIIPPAGQGRLVRYAINLYPTARLVRFVLSR